MPLYPPFWRPFKQNGGYFQRNMPISETKRRRVSIFTLCLCFVGHRLHRKYCRIHHAISSTILEAILQNCGHFQSKTSISETKRCRAFNFDSMSRFCGAYTCRTSIVSYVSVLGINHFDFYGGHFTKWRPFLQNGGHFHYFGN